MTELPLVLLSGMGADERLFEGLFPAFPTLVVPRWIDPAPAESIADYAARLAATLNINGPCFVGGASFGGIIAQALTHHVDARACFIISSITSPRELPPLMRIWRPFGRIPEPLFHRLVRIMAVIARVSLPRPTARRIRQLAAPERRFERWATLAMLRWEPARLRIPRYHIHGDADRTLPVRYTRPDVVVRGGDHILPYRMPTPVIKFIKARMQ